MALVANAKFSSFTIAFKNRENSDAIGFKNLQQGGFFASIADGVGSALHGGDAARIAVATSLELADSEDIQTIFSEVNARIKNESGGDYKRWSSTLSICRLRGNIAEVGHVGDARIYHLRGSGIQSRTRDQTEVERLIHEGVLTRERAMRYPRRNVLLSALSGDGIYELQEASFEVQENDRLLLLTDGLYKQITKREIANLSLENRDVQDFIDALRKNLVVKGVIDDSSALCVDVNI